MRMLGLDFGTKRIGLAAADREAGLARPLATLARKGGVRDLEAVARLAAEQQAEEVVVGLPLNMDGSEGRMARLAREFAAALGARTGLPVHLWDERLSSFEAEAQLREVGDRPARRKQKVDQVAAALILESYLEAHR
ncbi:MAG TPA: Holliday junction resolvase RuvX [Myxococcota bacterium]|nr:Holliday junction resolvase RuvX [Myxococcota bacterium]HRY93478.1 Holliday junction resolvase RuvX [Myxococcota bacterium]